MMAVYLCLVAGLLLLWVYVLKLQVGDLLEEVHKLKASVDFHKKQKAADVQEIKDV